MAKKKRKKSKKKNRKSGLLSRPGSESPYVRAIPVYDYIADHDLSSEWGIGECMDNLIFNIKGGYFLTWEAVVRKEQGLPLSEKHKEVLDSLLCFTDDDEPIFYIDEMPRPNEPWYEIVRKIAPGLVLSPFKTFEIHNEIYHEGWPEIADCLERYASDLSLPEGVSSPIEVVPPDTRHKLWLQYCFDELSGLGQEEELTLEDKEQKKWRVKGFINCLRECKESVEFFDLTLDKLFKLVILPPKDENILTESLLNKLGMKSSSEKIIRSLKSQ
ncbi:hypothetical protein QUF80_11000 [Desulfococcaceae bacterium HSG8]|nr:hypothetical protein [Desulfococcaceae bacterium HSG8]